jgi:FAD/FMN-containing dehydrogenase
MVIHPIDRAWDVLRFYRDLTAGAPDALTAFAVLLHTPDGHPVVAIVLCYSGSLSEGEAVVRPIREFGPPMADMTATMPYTALQSMLDEGFAAGPHVYWRSDFLRALSDEALRSLIDHFAAVPSPLSAVVLENFGGAVKRVGRDETAFDHRDADYNLALISRWLDPADQEKNVAWVRGLWTAMRPHAAGVYVNYLGVGEGQELVRAAYGDAKYERLVTLKAKYDPTNFFRLDQNIKPPS